MVTGAARGMGRAFALALAREQCGLVLCDALEGVPDGTPYPKATQAEFDETINGVRARGRRCVARRADMRDQAEAARLIDAAVSELGRLDFLVSNRAITIERPIVEMSSEIFSTVLQNNLVAAFKVLSPADPAEAGAGRDHRLGFGPACRNELRSLRGVEMGLYRPRQDRRPEAAKSGVTVNIVLPGPTDTAMMDNPIRWKEAAPEKPEPTRDDYLEAKKDATPMGVALVKPEDVAAAVVFLLTDEARFISGDTLSVDAADCANWT